MSSTLESYRLLIAEVYELAGTSRRTSDAIAKTCDQSVARWHVMSALSESPLTVAATARRLGLRRQGVQRVVNELVDDALAERLLEPRDKRAPLIALTARGRRILADIVAASDDDRRELLRCAGATQRQLDDARRVLRALLDAFDEAAAPRTRG